MVQDPPKNSKPTSTTKKRGGAPEVNGQPEIQQDTISTVIAYSPLLETCGVGGSGMAHSNLHNKILICSTIGAFSLCSIRRQWIWWFLQRGLCPWDTLSSPIALLP